MDAKDLAQYHTTAESLAAELAMRRTMAQSGFSDEEIDQMQITWQLQMFYFSRGLVLVLLLALGAWGLGVASWPWTLVALAGAVPAWFIVSRVIARRRASMTNWRRVKGGWQRA